MSSNKKLKVSRSTRYRRRLNAATLATTMLCDSSDDEPLATQLSDFTADDEPMDIQLKTIEIVPSSNNELICESNFNHSTDYIIQSDDTNSIDSSLISSPSQFLNTAGSDTNSDSIDLQSSLSPSHELSIWALHHNITHIALGDLLKFLKKHTNLTMLPNDPQTLLKTPAKTQITKIDGGDYHHLGLKMKLNFYWKLSPN
ncbi:unnamed protein product [Macrosiphum euphorbiae]|uniref:Uncharacterized protein n=1 Tax=Macrosiphum euphorbiae TaxID=13131 RepID=A0AAV0Y6S3_9HEMI|nr:unnamed protein product [Macrosiphum euphorbiae]